MVSSAENANEALKVLEQRNDIGYFSPAFKRQARSTEWIWAAAVLNHRRTDNIKELLRRFSVQRLIDELRSYVILDYLGHEARHRTPGAGGEIHHLFAARLAVERAARPGPACAARAPATFVSSRHGAPAPLTTRRRASSGRRRYRGSCRRRPPRVRRSPCPGARSAAWRRRHTLCAQGRLGPAS